MKNGKELRLQALVDSRYTHTRIDKQLVKEEVLNQWLNKQLKAGLIKESKSRYAASCFYIPKKDGSLRLVQDYQKLNQVTIKDKMPLPLIGEVINKLKEASQQVGLDLGI